MSQPAGPTFQDDDIVCFCTVTRKGQLVDAIRRAAVPAEVKSLTRASMVCMGCELDVDHVIAENAHLLRADGGGAPAPASPRADERTPRWQRQAAWVIEDSRLRSRLVMANLEIPNLEHGLDDVPFTMTFYDFAGRVVARDTERLTPRNGVTTIECQPLVQRAMGDAAYHGIVEIDGWQPFIGGTRVWVQWYNDQGMTTTHERFDGGIYRAHRRAAFACCTSVTVTSSKNTYFVLSNLHVKPYRSRVVLRNASGTEQFTTVDVPHNGSVFEGVKQTFRDAVDFLDGQPGVLYFEERRTCSMVYCFIHDEALDTWHGQHT